MIEPKQFRIEFPCSIGGCNKKESVLKLRHTKLSRFWSCLLSSYIFSYNVPGSLSVPPQPPKTTTEPLLPGKAHRESVPSLQNVARYHTPFSVYYFSILSPYLKFVVPADVAQVSHNLSAHVPAIKTTGWVHYTPAVK